MRPRRVALLGLVLATLLGGCRSKGAEPSTQPAPDPDATVLVEIESHFMGDVVIYLVRGSLRQRLGMVTALSSTEFNFRWRNLGGSSNNHLVAYPIAGTAFASEPLLIQPGQWIKWTLESDLRRSSLAVY